ncbi:MAG TPA: TM0106 family RecB-like putative nuclease [Candidatus Limnocylindria bacterium]|nr:TM0106 family RecB-like putative nuclease [Candidatus Limnocylindria bacterium]
MQLIDGRAVYSATDLVGFLACEHLTQLERAVLAGLAQRPNLPDPELDVLRKRGEEHERRYVADLAADGRSVVVIERDAYSSDHVESLRIAADETVKAMASGAQVIYQATFFNGHWRGHADFLLRRDSPDQPSTYGPFHYEVADTKLARHVKASAVLQICSYVDQLTVLQGVQPEWLHVALGGSAHETVRLRVDDFMAYYRASKRRFEEAVGPEAAPAAYPPPETYPEPVEHCDVCRWTVECKARRRSDDHLSLVAGIGRQQRRALVGRGVTTLEQLGSLPLPLTPPLDGSTERTVERIREQARIQLEGRREGTVKYELLVPEGGQRVEPERGLSSLPLPSPGDLFFDIEGDPYAFEDGLEYLFGVMEDDGRWHAIWSTDVDGGFTFAGEKAAFEALMDLFTAQLDRFPDAHIYHFHSYEPSALKHLMGKHATRELEVDRLLRGGAMVDLHRIVRQALRASVESYGLKSLEPLYGYRREVDLRDAGSSIVAFEQWLELGEGERPAADHLLRIERYNRDDVISTRELRDWLEARRYELAGLTGAEVGRPAAREGSPTEEQAVDLDRVARLEARLTLGVPPDPADRSPEQQATWLLAQLLSWHRREDKATWWHFHHLLALNSSQLIEETDPIGGLEPVEPLTDPDPKGRQLWRYRFPAQEYRVSVRDEVYDPRKAQLKITGKFSDWGIGTVRAIDHAARTVDVQRLAAEPHPSSLVPLSVLQTKEQRGRLLEIGDWVAERGIAADGQYRAARDLLLRRPPRAGQTVGEELRHATETQLGAARNLALRLDHTTLPIQGPPGSGKTYTGARMIASLLRAGKRVGIIANSHKVIGNMISAALLAAAEDGVEVRALQKADKDQKLQDDRVGLAKDAAHAEVALATGAANLVAGTVWLWASPRMADAVDVLFVDEAGQISLANVIAASTATKSIVLLGDPQQLDQVIQGSHPPGAERSALGHLLGAAATMPPTDGLFLATTWRLHPDLCRFTSETFYDSRLEPEPQNERQAVHAPGIAGGTGSRWLPVPHRGNDNESAEEAAVIAILARSLIEGGATWRDRHGIERPIGWDEIVVVAPYNAQVGAIQRLLPPQARVGTVDKFQGQEAPVSIYSMAASSGEEAPRGMDFLYSAHRLNVATSRARCIALVVASPDLPRVGARTVQQMRLANALCRFVEMARGELARLTTAPSSGHAEPERVTVL